MVCSCRTLRPRVIFRPYTYCHIIMISDNEFLKPEPLCNSQARMYFSATFTGASIIALVLKGKFESSG